MWYAPFSELFTSHTEIDMTAHSENLPDWIGRGSDDESDTDDEQARAEPQSHSTTGGDFDQEPVVVWEAANNLEAQIVRGRLEAEGIPAIVRGEALGAIYGLTTGSLAATDVLVPAPLAEKALEILNSEVVWDEEDFPDDESDEPDHTAGG